MTYKTILVHLSDAHRAPQLLGAAMALAERFGAHLVTLHVVPQPYVPIAPYGDAAGEIIERERRTLLADADRIDALVEAASAGLACKPEHRRLEAHLGPVSGIVTSQSRTADLVIAAEPQPGLSLDYRPADVAEDVMMGSGRPVLMLPPAPIRQGLGSSVLIAWNASREAARAVHDALPLLMAAREVRILTVGLARPAAGMDADAGDRLAASLRRHGIGAVTAWTLPQQRGIADELRARIEEAGADLLVMGGYGHGRLREAIFGGATAGMLAALQVPVLISH